MLRPRSGSPSGSTGDTVADAGFDADGCGAATAAGSAAVTLVRGATLLDAARIGAREIAAELGGLSPGKLHAAELAADALARALGAAARAGASLGAARRPDARRDERWRRQRGRRAALPDGGATPSRSRSSCGPTPRTTPSAAAARRRAVAQARSLAHGMGLPHFTIDLRDEFRAGVVEPFIAGYAAGETPNPCVGCNGHVRLDAMLELADRLGCEALATGHYARTAETDDPAGPLLRAAADPAKDQTYMLAALSPASLARMRFPLGELTKPEVRAIAARGGSAGRGQGRLAGSVLPRRHQPGAVPRPPRRSRRPPRRRRRRARRACSPATTASTGSPSASGAGSASPPASRCTCSTRTPPPTASSSARAARCATGSVALRGVTPAPTGRARRPGQAPLPLAAAGRAARR